MILLFKTRVKDCPVVACGAETTSFPEHRRNGSIKYSSGILKARAPDLFSEFQDTKSHMHIQG